MDIDTILDEAEKGFIYLSASKSAKLPRKSGLGMPNFPDYYELIGSAYCQDAAKHLLDYLTEENVSKCI